MESDLSALDPTQLAALALALMLAVTLIVLTFKFVRALWRRLSGREADPQPMPALPR